MMRDKMEETMFEDNDYVLLVFIEKGNPSEKVVILEEDLDDIDIDSIASLEDLPKLVFIDEKCRNLKVIVDDVKLTKKINKKKKTDFLQTCRYPLCHKQNCFFYKHMEYCESVR